MRPTLLVIALFIPSIGRAQLFGVPQIVFDPANKGINAANLAQMEQLYQNFVQYRQMFESATANFRCPSCFLSAASNAVGAVQEIMVENGNLDPASPSTVRNIANLRKVLAVGQIAAQQAQIGQAMSTGNGSSVALLTIQMAQTAQQINTQLQLLQQQAQVDYYHRINGYTPQTAAINSWRLK